MGITWWRKRRNLQKTDVVRADAGRDVALLCQRRKEDLLFSVVMMMHNLIENVIPLVESVDLENDRSEGCGELCWMNLRNKT